MEEQAIPIREMIRKQVEAENALVEEWVERSITSGKIGVKVVRKEGRIVEIGLSKEVPYGHIYEHLT